MTHEDDHGRDHDLLRTRCNLNCLNKEGLHLRTVLGCSGEFLVANRGMLMMARAPFALTGR
eukprot:7845260-Pyramimonas_sp.AAC.1